MNFSKQPNTDHHKPSRWVEIEHILGAGLSFQKLCDIQLY